MLTASQARELGAKESVDELAILEKAIKIVAVKGRRLLLRADLTPEAKVEQDKLFPNFTGHLQIETIAELRRLGYDVECDDQYSCPYVAIQW